MKSHWIWNPFTGVSRHSQDGVLSGNRFGGWQSMCWRFAASTSRMNSDYYSSFSRRVSGMQ